MALPAEMASSPRAAPLRFAFLADSQLGCMARFSGSSADDLQRLKSSGLLVRSFPATTGFAWEAARLRAAVPEVLAHDPAFVVIGGDMVDDIAEAEQVASFRQIIAGFGVVPVHLVAGNHDACTDTVVPTESSLAQYEATFGPANDAFSYGGHTFISCNSTVLDDDRHVPGGADRELAFVAEALEAASDRGGQIAVFMHHPPFVEHPDEDDSYWNLPARTRHRFLALLEQHDVAAVFCGHRHRNAAERVGSTEIVTSSALGFPLGTDPPGYRIVEVDEHGVRHRYHSLADPGWEGIGGAPDAHAN